MNIKVIIAMHKPYVTPKDEMYVPLHVGAAGKEKLTAQPDQTIWRDDTGEHISQKNPYYCELTGLYWAWKNLSADAIGLAHYRRHFSGKKKSPDKMERVLSQEEAKKLFENCDILVPKKRNYYIESLYTHYSHTHDGAHLDMAREIIAKKYPEYTAACVKGYTSTWGYMFNMCIMKREYLDAYCTWLFDILEELEKQLEATGKTKHLSSFDARLYGRVSEILFNVWLQYQLSLDQPPVVKEISYMHMESINWIKKGTAFLKAKLFGKKYDASF